MIFGALTRLYVCTCDKFKGIQEATKAISACSTNILIKFSFFLLWEGRVVLNGEDSMVSGQKNYKRRVREATRALEVGLALVRWASRMRR